MGRYQGCLTPIGSRDIADQSWYISYFISLALLNILKLLIQPQDVSAGKSSLFYILPIDIRRILMHFQVWKPSPLVISDRNKNALLPLVVVS